MLDSLLPLHHFSERRMRDMPFQIGRIEDMPAMARSPQPHRHTFYEIFCISNGSGSHYIDFEAYPILPNTLYFISPGQVHFWRIDQSVTGYAMLFTEDFMATNLIEQITLRSVDFFHRIDHQPRLSIESKEVGVFHELCQHMLQEYQSSAFGRLAIVQSLFLIFLVQAQRQYKNASASVHISSGERLIEDYYRLIDLHFHDKKTVREYAALLSITPNHLTDTTRRILGVSASRLIDQRIIVEAKRLLAHSEQTIAQICQELHFDDQSYFTRFFKRATAQTPTGFRRTIREKYQESP